MFAKLLTGFYRKAFSALIFALLMGVSSYAQDTIGGKITNGMDSTLVQKLSDLADTIISRTSNLGLGANVEYESKDSIRFEMNTSRVHMYEDAKIVYDKIKIDADYILIEFNTNELIAEGVKDSTGVLVGNPVFTEDEKVYKSKYMKYNYKTKKGFIKDVVTEDGEGFLHGTEIMKLANNEINVSHGSFTTCSNIEHPHFEFRFNKSKVIPGKKIVTGPAYLVIEGVSTPLAIPFGMFPNKTGQRSGIVMPRYGESANRGFFLENGGYYFAINDYLDLKVTGDIYSRGSWAIKPIVNYVKKYKYRGSLDLGYAINITGEDNENTSKDFSIKWSHSQDPKARPNSTFSANVNIVSNKFNSYNSQTTAERLANTFQSSISYQTKIAGKYPLTMRASHSQNTLTKMVTMTLPDMSFSVNQFYPFRKKGKAGQFKWYDNITMSYSMNAKNEVSIADSLLFKPEMFAQIRNGIKHSIPISSNLKILKVFNFNTTAQFNNRNYFSRTEKSRVTETLTNGQDTSYLKLDTIPGFFNVFDYNLSANISTTIYGQVDFKKTSALRAIRHVVTPSIGFRYQPDFSEPGYGYYDYYYKNDDHTDSTQYSYYERNLYGTAPEGKQGSINFSIGNNLEIKVRSKKDTITGTKKIVLIKNFSISTSYNMFADSLKWAPISMNGNTRLFDKLDLNYGSSWDLYTVDSSGNRINTFEWKANKKLLRPINSSWRFGLTFKLKSKMKGSGAAGANEGEGEISERTSKTASEAELRNINDHPEQYIDWTIPWELNINYNFNYSNTNKYRNFERDKESKIVQTLGISGNVSVTPKWKVEYRADYDFENKKISLIDLRILRDLHCWSMSFNWIPLGNYKSWSFSLNVKASVLQDLKLDKKKDFRDTY
ncbi:MAG: hypothetical protein CVU00_03520 [Bacteroidetes bacterium HGW-Bacteroidetes-17]|nr:MAG: hypothetical protein CVU00_03520 [Bacteroidetes bacterium HGW-Bacteroidetes-17]